MSKPLAENTTGIFSLMLTPYNDDLTVDWKTYEEYCDYQTAQGVDHLFAVCGSSEMANLTLEERLKLATLTAKHKGDTTIVATANMEASWFAQVEEVKRMSDTGVDGLVFVTKGFGKDPERLISYIGELKSYTTLPVFMYEFPGIKPHLIDGKTYGRLVSECGISGIKDTTCTVDGITDKIRNKGNSTVLQANMPYLFEAYKAGSQGVMATPTSCGGSFFVRFHEAFMKGDMALAEKRFHEITLLDNAIDNGFNCSAKYLVKLQGVENFKPINRSGCCLSPARLESLKAFHDWAKANELMI